MSAVAQMSPAHRIAADPAAGRVPNRRRGSGPTNAAVRALSERVQALGLLDTGIAATAVIASFRLTNTTCNGVPVVALGLAIEVPDQSPRVAVRYAVVPMDDHPAPGTRPRVPVLVDREPNDNVLLRFDLRPLS